MKWIIVVGGLGVGLSRAQQRSASVRVRRPAPSEDSAEPDKRVADRVKQVQQPFVSSESKKTLRKREMVRHTDFIIRTTVHVVLIHLYSRPMRRVPSEK